MRINIKAGEMSQIVELFNSISLSLFMDMVHGFPN